MDSLKADDELAGSRLDVVVAGRITPASRPLAQTYIANANVLVNGKPSKSGYKLKNSDEISINIPKAKPVAELKISIIYEDKDVIVLNKPSGVLTHSKGGYNPEPTVASFIASKLTNLSGNRAGIVHRLDRGTSGVIICAKNTETMKLLQKQFSTRNVKKVYTAVAKGIFEPNEAVIDIPIARSLKEPQKFTTNLNGKQAITHYKVLNTFNKGKTSYCLVEFSPKTGRTHQLRVHSAKLGHPIVGDQMYGGEPHSRLMLHAKSLELTLPGGKRRVFRANTPKEFDIFNA